MTDKQRRTLTFADRRFDGITVSDDGEEVIQPEMLTFDPTITAEMIENASDDVLDLLADRLWQRIQRRMLAPHRAHG